MTTMKTMTSMKEHSIIITKIIKVIDIIVVTMWEQEQILIKVHPLRRDIMKTILAVIKIIIIMMMLSMKTRTKMFMIKIEAKTLVDNRIHQDITMTITIN